MSTLPTDLRCALAASALITVAEIGAAWSAYRTWRQQPNLSREVLCGILCGLLITPIPAIIFLVFSLAQQGDWPKRLVIWGLLCSTYHDSSRFATRSLKVWFLLPIAAEIACFLALVVTVNEQKAWPLAVVSFHASWTSVWCWFSTDRLSLVIPPIMALVVDAAFMAVPRYLLFTTAVLSVSVLYNIALTVIDLLGERGFPLWPRRDSRLFWDSGIPLGQLPTGHHQRLPSPIQQYPEENTGSSAPHQHHEIHSHQGGRPQAGREETEVNVAVLGGSNVGKTALVMHALGKGFKEETTPTIEDLWHADIMLEGQTYKLKLLEVGGQEKLASAATKASSRDGVLLIYSITSRSSFELVETLYRRIKSSATGPGPLIMLVGNKLDCKDEREVSLEDLLHLGHQLSCDVIEVSAKNKDSTEVFHQLVKLLRRRAQQE